MEETLSIGSKVGTLVKCSSCSAEGNTDNFIAMQDNAGNDVYLCPSCKEKVKAQMAEETEDPNILTGVILGSIGAAIGGVIWFLVTVTTEREIGYISLGLGYLVGYGVHLGSGGKRGHFLQLISAAISIVAIIVTEKFIYDYLLNAYVHGNPDLYPDIGTNDVVSIPFFALEFWKSLLSPIGLLIYSIGIYVAYSICRPRKLLN